MTQLLVKDTKFEFNGKSFELIKKALTNPPLLAHANFNLPFRLYCDASHYQIGYCLCRLQNGEERVILYGSRTLTERERHYTTTEPEAMACWYAIRELRPFLLGQEFEVITDHESLKCLLTAKSLQGRLLRWALDLQQYLSFQIVHRSGHQHGNADGLSRIKIADEYAHPNIRVINKPPTY